MTYGTDTTLLTSSGIVDTGTTLLLLATSAFDSYQQATGGVLDQATGLLKITEEQYNNLQSLFFNIGGVSDPNLVLLLHNSPNDRRPTNLLRMHKSGPVR